MNMVTQPARVNRARIEASSSGQDELGFNKEDEESSEDMLDEDEDDED